MGAPSGAEPIKVKPKEEEKKKTEETLAPAPATIVVSLPAEAKLTIDDTVTTSTSNRRTFVTPTLPLGQEFHYTLKAEFAREGKPVVLSKQIAVKAGAEVNVTLNEASLNGVASR